MCSLDCSLWNVGVFHVFKQDARSDFTSSGLVSSLTRTFHERQGTGVCKKIWVLFLSLEKWPSEHLCSKNKLCSATVKNKETRYLDYLEIRWTIRSVDAMLIWWNGWSWGYPKNSAGRPAIRLLNCYPARQVFRFLSFCSKKLKGNRLPFSTEAASYLSSDSTWRAATNKSVVFVRWNSFRLV